ncbi:MAG: ornithine cyclodeaminase family protein [Gemmatimonadetes bacterium]|nr:ornithine cyclodeaminase family protein [Gemmatimonadota bacterium]MYG85212.1 ornithine cyclodeaminase family protein [Gemmatimonadota bacterium]MYJ91241.1 ornithine cyclodeaminase family protein [Gemmatimonadota bacterium]
MNLVRLLSRSDMASVLTMPDVIEAVEEGFRSAGERDDVPVRLPVHVADRPSVALFMPAYLAGSNTLGAKVVSAFHDNPARGLPMITGFYVLCDAETGRLIALMDATFLTGIRTAAASAVATKYLARKDSRVLGIIGTGVQGRFHVDAITAVRPIERIVVYNRTPERGRGLADDLASRGMSCRLAETAADCAAEADVLAVCTSSKKPLFDGGLVRPGSHVNAVGVFTADSQELDTGLIQRARVFVDTYEGAFEEAGDIIVPLRAGDISRDHIRAELTELVTGRKEGRTGDGEITVFKSVGYAMEDAVTARLAYERAADSGVGATFDLEA